MTDPRTVVERALDSLALAESSGLEFVDVKPNNIAGKHWRASMQALVPVSTGSSESDDPASDPVSSPSAVEVAQVTSDARDAVAALSAKFKTPPVASPQVTKFTLPAKSTQTTQPDTESLPDVTTPADSTIIPEPEGVSDPPGASRDQLDPLGTPRASVPLPDSAEAYPVNVADDSDDGVSSPSPDRPLKKRKKKRKVKAAKAAETQSAMAWTMRR